MFNLGFTELIALSAIALLVIGPKQLPGLARSVARMLNELKRATGGLKDEFSGFDSAARKQLSEITDKTEKLNLNEKVTNDTEKLSHPIVDEVRPPDEQ